MACLTRRIPQLLRSSRAFASSSLIGQQICGEHYFVIPMSSARLLSTSQRLRQVDEWSADGLDAPAAGEEAKPLATQKGGTSPAVGQTVDISNLEKLEKSFNRVQLMGRVGSEPQLRGTERNPVLLFSLATHENFRDETGALKQKTMWHRIAVFKSGLRETTFKYLKKGQRVFVNGQISYGMVKDPTINVIRTTTSIIGEDVIILSGPTPSV